MVSFAAAKINMAILGRVFVASHLGLFYLFNDHSNYNGLL